MKLEWTATTLLNACHASVFYYRVKHDMMAANYISQLSETDVQYNLVNANRQIFKQE